MEDVIQKLREILSTEQGQNRLRELFSSLDGQKNSLPPVPSAGKGASSDPLGDLLDGFLQEHGHSPEEAEVSPPPGGADTAGGLDVGMLMKLGPVLSKLGSRKEDKNTRLIMALKPHLQPERQKKADEALRMLQLMELIPLVKDLGLFDGLLHKE